jgi:hypothetical protein
MIREINEAGCLKAVENSACGVQTLVRRTVKEAGEVDKLPTKSVPGLERPLSDTHRNHEALLADGSV